MFVSPDPNVGVMVESSVLHQVGDDKHGAEQDQTSGEVQHLVGQLHQLRVGRNIRLVDDRSKL